MNVVHLCESDSSGGAARGAFRLHSALQRRGLDSRMIVGHKGSTDWRVRSVVSPTWKKLHERLDALPRRLLRTKNESHVSPAWIGSNAGQIADALLPDLLHLHWINKGFLRIESLPKLRTPLVWSLHDMWPFAGGEHYVDGCTRYREGYSRTNRPTSESGFDLNRWVWKRKARAWASIRQLTFFAVSEWLADRVRESVLFRDRPVYVLHNALDTGVFQPRAQAAAREELGLPQRTRLLLFGALDATRDRRKGFDLLVSALQQLRAGTLSFEIVVFGNQPGARAADLGFKTHYLGEIDDSRRLALVYSACDAMAVPSREESFGQTALEALACGTPVVAFGIGGIPEVVEHKISGYLAAPGNAADLATGIHYLLAAVGTPHWRHLAHAGRTKVERSFTLPIQAKRCEMLYERVLGRPAEQTSEPSEARAIGATAL